jgi:hypothetical protein
MAQRSGLSTLESGAPEQDTATPNSTNIDDDTRTSGVRLDGALLDVDPDQEDKDSTALTREEKIALAYTLAKERIAAREALADGEREHKKRGLLRALGRVATSPMRGFKKADNWLSLKSMVVLGKMPGMKTTEELNAAYHKRQEKYAAHDSDSFLKGRLKHFMRNREKYMLYGVPMAMGAVALSRLMAFDHALHMAAPRGVTIDASQINVEPTVYKSSMIVAGGRGQPDGIPMGDLQSAGFSEGVNVQSVHYPAQIAPLDAMSMNDSTNIGVDDMYGQAKALMKAGQPVNLFGYSEGSAVAKETADRLMAENNGHLPPGVTLTVVGSPYGLGGALDGNNPFTKGISGAIINQVGIPAGGQPLPPGTHVVYYDSDFWANSSGQTTTSMLRQLVELGFGGHAMPNPNDPSYTFTDVQGVIHTVYTHNDVILQSLMDNNGLYVADTVSANKAINDILPLDRSRPNVAAAIQDLATTLEHQPDPASQFAGQFIRSLPPEYARLGQAGMDAFNKITEGGAKIQAGDVIGGFNEIQDGFNDFFKGVNAAFPHDAAKDQLFQQQLVTGVNGLLQQATGHDFTQPINEIVGMFSGGGSQGGNNSLTALPHLLDQFQDIAKTAPATPVSAPTGNNFMKPLTDIMNTLIHPANQPAPGAAPSLPDLAKPLNDIASNFTPPQNSQSVPTPDFSQITKPIEKAINDFVPAPSSQPAPTPELTPITKPLTDIVNNYVPPAQPASQPDLTPITKPLNDIVKQFIPQVDHTPAPQPVAPVDTYTPPQAPAFHFDAPALDPAPAPAPAELPPPSAAPTPSPAPVVPSFNQLNTQLNDMGNKWIPRAESTPASAPAVIPQVSTPAAPPAFDFSGNNGAPAPNPGGDLLSGLFGGNR